jgi:AbrB family looped-hinge helix DNA binding protein
MPTALITSKGQITIPKEIRDYLHIQAGDKVDFIVEENCRVVLEPATMDISELDGALHRPGMKAVSDATINAAVRKRFGAKYK